MIRKRRLKFSEMILVSALFFAAVTDAQPAEDEDEGRELALLGIPMVNVIKPKPHIQNGSLLLNDSGCSETWRSRFNEIMTQNLTSGKPWFNTNYVEGFIDQFSYNPGAVIKLSYNGTNVPFGVTIRKHGAQTAEIISQSSTTLYKAAPVADECATYIDTGVTGWPQASLQLPANLTSGLYSIVLTPDASVGATTNSFYIPFVVKNNTATAAPILFVSASLTWVAYNPWGGGCVYNNLTGKPTHSYGFTLMSLNRPLQAEDPEQGYGTEAGADTWFLKWLQKNNYSYDVISDFDFDANPSIVNSYKVVVTASHAEYWTQAMVSGIKNYIAKGGSVINTGGNIMYYKTVVGSSGNAPSKSQVQILRAPFLNGDPSDGTIGLDGQIGGKWATTMHTPESSVSGTILNTSFKLSQAGLKVTAPNHWIFKGTHVKKNQMIGLQGKNAPPYTAVTDWNGNAGASGWEVNIVDASTPPGTVRLASGTNPGGGADMVYFKAGKGGEVFSASSITYSGSLVVDPVLTTMQKNVLDRFLKKPLVH